MPLSTKMYDRHFHLIDQFEQDCKFGRHPVIADFARQFPQELYQDAVEELQFIADSYPTRIGPYEVVQFVTERDDVKVLKVSDAGGQAYAMKVAKNREGDKRIWREAVLLADLDHPHVVQIRQQEEIGQHAALLMEWLDGQLLEHAAFEDQRQIVQMILPVVDAVAAAHSKGIVHCDIKPSNIMLTTRGAVLFDFNVGQVFDATTLHIRGTPGYMAPEQASGGLPDGRSDIYSVGAVLLRLLTGSQGSFVETIDTSSLDPGLEAVIRRCLALKPRDRYQRAEELLADLRRWLDGKRVSAQPVRRQRLRAAHALSVTALGALAALAWWLVARWTDDRITVHIATDPPGANVVVYPLTQLGSPDADGRIRAGPGPCKVRLRPGEYLVAAWVNEHSFNEVFRTVPQPRQIPGQYKHNYWDENEDGSIVWGPVVCLRTDTQGMIEHRGLWLDQVESMIGEDYYLVVDAAEEMGKRVPLVDEIDPLPQSVIDDHNIWVWTASRSSGVQLHQGGIPVGGQFVSQSGATRDVLRFVRSPDIGVRLVRSLHPPGE